MSVERRPQSWLMRDISLALALKAAALALLYFAFFAHPVAPSLTPDLVARHLDRTFETAPAFPREDAEHARN
jgi:hypothetical protein